MIVAISVGMHDLKNIHDTSITHKNKKFLMKVKDHK